SAGANWKRTGIRPIKIWALTDGLAGNETQARGLAEAVARARSGSVDVKRVPLTKGAGRIPAVLAHRIHRVWPGWPMAGVARDADPIAPPWPDLVIGAGRRSGPVVAALGRRQICRTVQILDPQTRPDRFDAVIVPSHDTLRGNRVLTTLGAMNRLTPDAVADAARCWQRPELPGHGALIAVLIGGPSRSSRFTDEDSGRLLEALTALAQRERLMVSVSRRTPAGLTEALRAELSGKAMVWGGPRDGPNPYPAMLGHADAILVTEDSVNMASEAASTGKPVSIFAIGRVAPKLASFHAALRDHGASRPFDGGVGHWTYPPLAEADRIAGLLAERRILAARPEQDTRSRS
ncbi:MAG: mitochondrial fission ELM1 family protein, partial [Pseudomonadota bacterium]